jgi:serine/threonine protein kinase
VDSHGLCCTLGLPCYKSTNTTSVNKDTWEEENLENIELLFSLTNFGFGEIYKGQFNTNKLNVTVKIYNGRTDSHDHFLFRESLIGNEIDALKNLKHNNIVKLYCICTQTEPKLVVTEYMSNGTLLNYLKMGIGAKFTLKEIIHVAWQVADGMKYMEERKWVHRDLGTRNIFVGDDDVYKSKFLIILRNYLF